MTWPWKGASLIWEGPIAYRGVLLISINFHKPMSVQYIFSIAGVFAVAHIYIYVYTNIYIYMYISIKNIIRIYNVYINPYWGNDHDGPISYMANWPNRPNFWLLTMAQISASSINKSLVIWSCSCMKSESFPSAKDAPLTLRLREW